MEGVWGRLRRELHLGWWGGGIRLRVVRIVEAGEAVGDDLSCGLGGGFGGLLVGELLGGSRLGLGGGCPYGKIVLGRERQGRLCGGDDEDLFELVEVSCRAKLNEGVGLVIGVGLMDSMVPTGRPRG